ncbi:alanine racemase [Urechidicola croceus]|uniref:Alanine racemase n=1 Tax=Urechidicola croceus TaxID=1850246 RepID=A0A1D8P9W7_9FLAO|nr:alanine racemase [Urechidicola croceus]AOW21382.1 alanine racemase [Urechidicola croceus]
MKNNHVTVLEIDLNAVKFNLNYFKSKLQENTQILVVVKAFGYGSDAVAIAKSIQNDVSYFAVAYTDEGIALRESGINTPILVLHPHIANLELDIQYCLEPNLYNEKILKSFLLLAKGKNLSQYPVHLKFNTGLNRLGFSENEIELISSTLKNQNYIKVKSIFSHMVASEDSNEREFTLKQIQSFERIISTFKNQLGYKPLIHMANTSGIINYQNAHFDMVRLGIGLYGFGNDPEETSKLRNVISLKSVISQIHTIEKGESVGYNRAYIADKITKTATIPIGHADGINRRLGQKVGYLQVNNQKAPIIGNVCMDMIMIDITNINCNEGDEVIIFDTQQNVEDLAQKADTISYELLTAVSQRVKRQILC